MLLKSRRNFLKSGFLGGAVFVMSGCELFGVVTPLQTIAQVQLDLFPHAHKNNINTPAYLTSILNHSRVTEDNKTFIRNGVKWLNEEAVEMYKKTYVKLSSQERQEVLKSISEARWGESWIHTMLTYIFEAMLSDPIYGANKNEAGWKWLNFRGGLPRPTKALV